jgi:hypothetical protein
MMLDSIDKSFNCSLPAKEKWSVFLAKVEKPAVWADRGADRIKVPLEIWTGCFPAGGFDQNCYSSVEHLAAQVHPGELPKKAQRGLAVRE